MSDAEGQAAATAAMDQSSFKNMERLLREDTAGEYTVGHMLGRGGMAVVYLATETQLSRKVALKVLPPELTFGHGVERFKREAKTAAALDHPNIIPIYRIASSGKLFWYAMKYLEGKSLEDMLRERGAFELDETIEILEQVADALDYAHEHHVIHRDIKPANVMLDNRNRVVVTDFGIAKALTEGKLTATDSVIGTPYFMSPEQGMGKTVTGASDQYSVAVMAYRMLAGHVPFDGDSAIDILHKHCMFPAPVLLEDVPGLPRHVSDAVARALSKKGDERFASVHDMVQSMKDPEFVPRAPARPSVATVMMDPAEARKMRGAASGSGGVSGKGRTVPQADNAAGRAAARAAAKTRLAPAKAAAPRSKMGLFVGIGAIVIASGGGITYWQINKTPQSPAAALGDATNLPTPELGTTPNLSALPPNDSAVGDIGSAVDPLSGSPSATETANRQPTTTKTPASPTPGSSDPVRPPTTRPPAPRQNAEKSTATVPVTQRPAESSPSPQANPDAGLLGVVQVRLAPPAFVFLDGRDLREKASLVERLGPGTHRLRVEKEGYITRDTSFTISAGDTTRFTIRLEVRP